MKEQVLVRNAGDPEQVRQAESQLKFSRENEFEDLKFVMSHPQGRRFVWRYLCWLNPASTAYSNTAMMQSYNIGKIDAARWIESEISQLDLELWITMLRENQPKQH